MPNEQAPFALELRGLTKNFGSVIANRNLSLAVRRGSIHALIGENGAGKSTAMNMLYGLYRPDSGQIFVDGRERRWRSSKDAKAAGIGMVHQHFMLAEPHSGIDNILLGDEPVKPIWSWLPVFLRPIDRAAARKTLTEIAKKNNLTIDLEHPAGEQPVGMQQRLEILKLLYRDANILVLDEPTAVLTPSEIQEFFANIRKLRDQGKTILIITHKLREVLALSDAITVIRRGETVQSLKTAETNEQQLADLMVGRAVSLQVKVPAVQIKQSQAGLEIDSLTIPVKKGRPRLEGLSLTVRPGEVVGIAGVEGNGQSELLHLLIDPLRFFSPQGDFLPAKGRVKMLDRDVSRFSARDVRRLGVGIVPEDRHREGLLLSASVARNYLLGHQWTEENNRFGILRWQENTKATKAAIAEFDIRPDLPEAAMSSLSGGNQQKVVIAREFRRNPTLFVFAQPTRGVDVGSIEFIHFRIIAARTAGHAVLLISSSLEEIIALSDRIVVMFDGRINGEFNRGTCTEADIGKLMGGVK